jgi:hypothetical protein
MVKEHVSFVFNNLLCGKRVFFVGLSNIIFFVKISQPKTFKVAYKNLLPLKQKVYIILNRSFSQKINLFLWHAFKECLKAVAI